MAEQYGFAIQKTAFREQLLSPLLVNKALKCLHELSTIVIVVN